MKLLRGRVRRLTPGYGAWGVARNALAACLVAAAAFAEPVTVAALGDSLTQGYGLPPEEGFVPELQAWLDERGIEAEVLNAGVSGDTSAGGLARIDWTLTPEVDALIVELGGNDLLRGIDPAETRANLDAILDAAEAEGVEVLLVGLKVPANYGADYKQTFDAVYPALARAHGVPLYPDFFAALEAFPDRAEAMRTYMQPDGLHPNAAGVALIVEAIGPAVAALIRATEAEPAGG